MNNESGSVLQKINFAVLFLIAAALGYLIARNRIDATRPKSESRPVMPAALAVSATAFATGWWPIMG